MSTIYRKPVPYRSPKTYRGEELAPAVPAPNNSYTVVAPWRVPVPRGAVVLARWVQPAARSGPVEARWGAGTPHAAITVVPWTMPAARSQVYELPWVDIQGARSAPLEAPWRKPAAQGEGYTIRWDDIQTAREAATWVPWRAPAPRHVRVDAPWSMQAPRLTQLTALWRQAAARGALIALPWGAGVRRRRLTDIVWPIEPIGNPITVPYRPAYIMLPSVSAVVLPDRTELPILGATVRTDVGSWAWQFSASIPLAALAAVRPEGRAEPVDIEITMNGYVWTFSVTKGDDQRRFGANTARISGASRSLVLAGDYSPRRTFIEDASLTAAQIADQALSGSGWSLVWDAVDWLIPGGTYSAQDATIIDEIATVANAIGARIETSRTALEVAVKPGFATMPWAFDAATPYAIIPASILPSLSGASAGGRNADGIYVLSPSYAAFVKVTGSAGAEQLPVVIDRLLTVSDASVERGRQELAKSSRIRTEQIQMPLFPGGGAPGLIPLDALLEVEEAGVDAWRGRVVAIEVTGQRGEALSVRQTLTLERHFR
jgi:hypothetical protein